MSKSVQEIYSGWLTKSPPTKRIWRGRWRRRWFVLHEGELPTQFILSYFTDRNTLKLKGCIDLERVEQIDCGLKYQNKKLKFDYMFAIKTPSRVYYLAAETEHEMKSWTKNICNLCKLGTSSDEEDGCGRSAVRVLLAADATDSPPISPASKSPYIPLSECITGKAPHQTLAAFTYNLCNNEFMDFSERMYLNCSDNRKKWNSERKDHDYCNFTYPGANSSPMQSPTDSESVFTDEDWTQNTNLQLSLRSTRPSSSSAEEVVKTSNVHAPPRPPKPQHISSQSSQGSCHNLPQAHKGASSTCHSKSNSTCEETNNVMPLTDEMYDFPRSHVDTLSKRHCYNNAAPSLQDGAVFTYDNPSTSQSQIFKYGDEITDEPASPLSQTSSTAQYSNLPSPLLPATQLMPPPLVNRGLKPKRKLSDSLSISSSNEPNSPRLAPCVDRKLKPSSTRRPETDEESLNRVFRAAPSPTPFGRSYDDLSCDDNEQVYYGSLNDQRKKLEYLDLDLDSKTNGNSATKPRVKAINEDDSRLNAAISTVYKKVDFQKTNAFNMTRSDLEKERNNVVQFKK